MAKNKKNKSSDRSFIKGLVAGIILTAVILFAINKLPNTEPGFPPTNSSIKIINKGENQDCDFPSRNAQCPGIHFNGRLSTAKLQESNLSNSTLEMSSNASDFSGSNLENATITAPEQSVGTIYFITKNNFSNIKGNGLTFKGVNIEDSNFQNAQLENAVFDNVELIRVDFTNANLKGADFSKAVGGFISRADQWNNPYQIDFSGANLSGANLTGFKNDFHHKVNYSMDTDFTGATWYDGTICGQYSLGLCSSR